MRHRTVGLALLYFPLLVVLGCRGEGPKQHIQVRDSAGVEIVENLALDGTELEQWRVSDPPLVEIGVAEGDGAYLLNDVRSAVRLSDGRIAVANAGTYEIRFYDQEGRFIRSVGGEGEEPGEFGEIRGMELGTSDSIYVFDPELQRLSIFDGSGKLARVSRVSSSTALAHVGRFADGRWYARNEQQFQSGLLGEIQRDTARYFLVDATFETESLITAFPGVMTALFGDDPECPAKRWAPFTPLPAQAAHGDFLYVVSGEDFNLRVFLSDGRLVRIVRNPGERLAVSDAHRAAWIDDILATVPEAARPEGRRVLENIPTPDTLPVYNDVVVDARGYVWLQEYTSLPGPGLYWSGSGRRWIVLSPAGELVARVETPVALDVFDIGSDYILGRWWDEGQVEYVRMYALKRPSEMTE